MSSGLFNLNGKRALITGSSQGIGFALAKGLAAAGVEIVLNGRNAEKLASAGISVTLVTPENKVSAWGEYTVEQSRTQSKLMELGVDIVTAHGLEAFNGREAMTRCVYSDREKSIATDALVMVTARLPNDGLYHELLELKETGASGAPQTVQRIGDCDAPAIIAAAVYAGHRYARELEETELQPPHRDRFVPG